MSAPTPSSCRSSSPSANAPRMKRVLQATSAAISSKRACASGSRSMPIRVPDQPRVPAAAEGAVHGDLARSGIQEVDELPGEHRDVDGHVKQDGQEMM